MNDFLCCTVGRLNESVMVHLYFLLFFLYILYCGQCMTFLLLFSVQEECWSPRAASGGGQLHQGPGDGKMREHQGELS